MTRKIFTLIGAGSTVFTPGLLKDLVNSKSSDNFEVRLYDINYESAEIMARVGTRIASNNGSKMTVTAFANRRDAIKNSDFITTTIAVGSAAGWKADLEIPRKYGIHQTVADSVGPGGVLRALRHIPQLVSIAEDVSELAPNAWFINYSNPLTANVRAISKYTNVKVIGLCHGTMHTRSKLLSDLGIESEGTHAIFAGINHLCWLIDLKRGSKNLYPELIAAVKKAAGNISSDTNRDEGIHSPVSADLFETFGLYPAPGDRHVAEFFSGYLKLRANSDLKWGLQGGLDMTEEYIGQKHDLWEELKGQASGVMPIADRDNQEAERLVSITEALISGENHLELAVNMPNEGKISNLPSNAIVEVPAIIGGNGIHGISIGVLPAGIAAVLTQRIHQQEITVEAARTVDRRLAIQALYMDPLVANYETAKSILDDAVAYAPETMSGFKE